MENQEYIKDILKKGGGIVLLLLGVLAVVYFVANISSKGSDFSQNFTSKYREAAIRGREVSNLINSVALDITEINQLDKSGKTDKALNLIENVKKDNNAAKKKANNLSEDLEGLTDVALENEDVSEAKKNKLKKAVNKELELIDELVRYTERIDKFLKALSVAIVSDDRSDRLTVSENLSAINSKHQEISKLNSELLAMVKQLKIFD